MGRLGLLKVIWIVGGEGIKWREQKIEQNRREGKMRTELHHFLFHNLTTADNFSISEARAHNSGRLCSPELTFYLQIFHYLKNIYSPSMDSCVCPVSLFLSCRFHFEWLKQPKNTKIILYTRRDSSLLSRL